MEALTTDCPSGSVFVTDGWRLQAFWVVSPNFCLIMKDLELCSLFKAVGTQTLLGWLDTKMAYPKIGRLEPFWKARQREFSVLSTEELYKVLYKRSNPKKSPKGQDLKRNKMAQWTESSPMELPGTTKPGGGQELPSNP